MRARWLKPEFFNDKKIGKLGPNPALVYEALWCMADDGGTVLCNPELVKGQMFSFWPMIGVPEISQGLEQLASEKRLERYTIGDDEYAIIVNFPKHQPVHNPSKFRHPNKPLEVTGAKDDRLRQEGGRASENGGSPHILDTYTPKLLDTYSAEFERLWKAYPKRAPGDNKQDAWKQYQARLKTGATHEEMFAGAGRYKVYCDATGKTGTEFMKQACTFLGKSRHYLDPWDIPPAATKSGHPSQEEQHRKRGLLT